MLEFQTDLATLDHLDDPALWRIARSQSAPAEMDRYQILLDKNANEMLSAKEREELTQLRTQFDRQMLCKAYAAVLLQQRGYQIPQADNL